MLVELRIRDYAVVEDLKLELSDGLNALTGETGAGKSILIGALNLVLGERADRTLIRAEADQCTVEAAFDVMKLDAPLADFLEKCKENSLRLDTTIISLHSATQPVARGCGPIELAQRLLSHKINCCL